MADPSFFDAIRIPSDVLVALDNRSYHFALQPWHHLLRLGHVLSTSAFFGGIALLDIRLIGIRSTAPLRSLAKDMLPWLYALFAVAIVTGAMLFFYAPVKVGSHAYFMPKMVLIVLGLVNVAVFHRFFFESALAATTPLPPRMARMAGAVSLVLWIGVVSFAALNEEAAPKVYLR